MAKTLREKPDRRKAPAKRSGAGGAIVSLSDEVIARRAFEVYCSRGGGHGQDLEDWLQAERELRGPDVQTA